MINLHILKLTTVFHPRSASTNPVVGRKHLSITLHASDPKSMVRTCAVLPSEDIEHSAVRRQAVVVSPGRRAAADERRQVRPGQRRAIEAVHVVERAYAARSKPRACHRSGLRFPPSTIHK